MLTAPALFDAETTNAIVATLTRQPARPPVLVYERAVTSLATRAESREWVCDDRGARMIYGNAALATVLRRTALRVGADRRIDVVALPAGRLAPAVAAR